MDDGLTLDGTAEPRSAKQRRWLPYAGLLVLLEVWLLLALIPRDFALMDAIQRMKQQAIEPTRRRSWLEKTTRNDPPLGTRVFSWRDERFRGVPVPPDGRSALVVFIGTCGDCVARDLLQWQGIAGQYPEGRLVLVARSTPTQVRDFVRKYSIAFPVVSDPEGKLGGAVNAAWFPRAYSVDPEGRVTWIQTNDRLTPVATAAAVWGSERSALR
jgi:hypothetical protein